MIEHSGARSQESLREKPAMDDMRRFPYPLKGIIKEVLFQDHPQNPTHQTVVHLYMMGGYSELRMVPVCTPKINANAGEEWTPEEGDLVLVQFVDGRWTDPVVTGYLGQPSNDVAATMTDVPRGKRRYHMKCNGTTVTVDKDGNYIINGAKDANITISGDVNLTIAGTANITVTEEAKIMALGGVTLDGSGTEIVAGVVTALTVCPFTQAPHAGASLTVKASM